MAKIKDRILMYLSVNGISKKKFCDVTGISYPNMNGKSLESEFGGEQIAEILMKFHEISPDWLILGEGAMLRSSTPSQAIINAKNMTEQILLGENRRLIEQYSDAKAEVALLKAEIARLKGECGDAPANTDE